MDPQEGRDFFVFLIITEASTRPELTCRRHPVKHAGDRHNLVQLAALTPRTLRLPATATL